MIKNPWQTTKQNIIYQNKFGYTLRDDDVITPAGKPGKYMVMESRDFAVIVALTPNNKVVFERHWRYPINQESLEIPAGGVEPGENPLETAKRELLEETGATSAVWKKLISYWTGNGAMKIRGHIFLAKDVIIKPDHPTEETEKISVELIDFNQALFKIDSGEITDDRTLLGLLYASK